MSNPNAPADLARYAEENGIDLTVYEETLTRLRGATSPKGKRFIDAEVPFAEDVLTRLRLGHDITSAVNESRDKAVAILNEQD